MQVDLGGQYAAALENVHQAGKHDDHRTERRRNDCVEDVLCVLQRVRVVEVHAEDPRNVRTEPKAAGEHSQESVGDEQLVAGRVQTEGELQQAASSKRFSNSHMMRSRIYKYTGISQTEYSLGMLQQTSGQFSSTAQSASYSCLL